MQKLPALLLFGTALLLAGCGNTLPNMGNEVSGWFGQDRPPAKGTPTRTIENVPPPVTGETLPAPSAPRAAKVALLLPLSGAQASLGQSFLDAAHMAVSDLAADSFELLPKDTGSDAASAGRAAQSAMAEGASLIVGPVFASAIPPVREKARAYGIPVLSLSNDWNAAGSGVYILGFNPAQQVRRALAFAAAKGITRIGLLAPNTAYGDAAERAAHGAPSLQLVATERYGTGGKTIAKAVEAISSKRGQMEALLIADGGQSLADIAKALTDVALSSRDIQIIGTGLWDEENVSAHNVLHGAFYAAPEAGARSGFAARYEKAIGRKPARLASLAYDAVALAAVLARQGQGYSDAALTHPNGFAGLDGIFRLKLDGTAERGLAILEVTQGGARVIDPAPRRF